MKKILILGGTHFQIPAIIYAKSKGYYVITCDYIPDNPGHKISDEYYNVSTTDKKAVLAISKDLKINGILCFCSDPAAPTAAYVSEQLGLHGNKLGDILKLGEKHIWRNFLKEHNFNTPRATYFTSYDNVDLREFNYPVMVKPVDSSGSKGVSKVTEPSELECAYNYALSYSRSKVIIIEEFIEKVGAQIGGDGFFGQDKLEFVCYGDQVVDETITGYVPCGMTFPSTITPQIQEQISAEIQRAISLSGLKNLSFNLEVMIDKSGSIYIMELGPRNGGNCIPEVIHNYTGVDMVALAVEAAMGNMIPIQPKFNDHYYAYYALHSSTKGIYKGYNISLDSQFLINDSYIFIDEGTEIDVFMGSNQTIGVLLLEFNNIDQMTIFFSAPSKYINLNISNIKDDD